MENEKAVLIVKARDGRQVEIVFDSFEQMQAAMRSALDQSGVQVETVSREVLADGIRHVLKEKGSCFCNELPEHFPNKCDVCEGIKQPIGSG